MPHRRAISTSPRPALVPRGIAVPRVVGAAGGLAIPSVLGAAAPVGGRSA